MENNQIIPIEKLPFDQFKLLGMEKKDVLALPKWTMDALRSGNRTSLIQFNNIRPNGLSEAVTINAKLSLQKDGDSYNLKMHPVNLQPRNDLELSPKEIEFLKKDPLNVLPKKVVDEKGKLVDSFITLDTTTNEFVAVKKDKLRPPEAINDIYLNEAQKKDFVNGKPIQLGKEEYRMDVNSENGVSGKNVEKIKFKSGEYSAYNFLLDAALIVSGLGVLVMVEHLAKMAFNNHVQVHDLMKQDLKPAIKRTVSNVTEKANNGIQLSNKDKNEMLVVNVKDTLAKQAEIKPTVNQTTDNAQQQKVAETNLPSFTYSGKLLEHGAAPYEFNKENKDNYFVRLATDAGERLVWGIDFGRAVQESNAKIGDQIGVDHAGTQAVKVNVDKKDNRGKVIGTEEKTIDRNNWNVLVLGKEIKLEHAQGNSTAIKPEEGSKPLVTTAKELPRDTKNTIFITFDATKDIKSQKAEINKQINGQLKNYDGNSRITVNKEIKALDFSRPEDQCMHNEQSAKITSLMNHISREVYNKTKAKFISTNDELKNRPSRAEAGWGNKSSVDQRHQQTIEQQGHGKSGNQRG